MSGNHDFSCPASPRPDHPIRGSRQWTIRVLELFDRDCMDDLEELCALVGVPVVSRQKAEYPQRPNTLSRLPTPASEETRWLSPLTPPRATKRKMRGMHLSDEIPGLLASVLEGACPMGLPMSRMQQRSTKNH